MLCVRRIYSRSRASSATASSRAFCTLLAPDNIPKLRPVIPRDRIRAQKEFSSGRYTRVNSRSSFPRLACLSFRTAPSNLVLSPYLSLFRPKSVPSLLPRSANVDLRLVYEGNAKKRNRFPATPDSGGGRDTCTLSRAARSNRFAHVALVSTRHSMSSRIARNLHKTNDRRPFYPSLSHEVVCRQPHLRRHLAEHTESLAVPSGPANPANGWRDTAWRLRAPCK
jgi:hypothetical protein